MNKYNLIFRKPKSEIALYVLGFLLLGGIIAIAATSPYFIQNLLREFKHLKKYEKKKVYNTFYDLKRQGLVNFYKKNNQIFISLTEKGKRRAGWLQINDLKIKSPKKWDGKWRVLMFDVGELKRLHREALRGKLISLGFVMLQKSVWIIPYDCEKEINLLKSFFSLSEKEIRLLIVQDIGEDTQYRKYFKLS